MGRGERSRRRTSDEVPDAQDPRSSQVSGVLRVDLPRGWSLAAVPHQSVADSSVGEAAMAPPPVCGVAPSSSEPNRCAGAQWCCDGVHCCLQHVSPRAWRAVVRACKLAQLASAV